MTFQPVQIAQAACSTEAGHEANAVDTTNPQQELDPTHYDLDQLLEQQARLRAAAEDLERELRAARQEISDLRQRVRSGLRERDGLRRRLDEARRTCDTAQTGDDEVFVVTRMGIAISAHESFDGATRMGVQHGMPASACLRVDDQRIGDWIISKLQVFREDPAACAGETGSRVGDHCPF